MGPLHDRSSPLSGGSPRRLFGSAALLATAALLGAPPLAHGDALERVPQDGTLQEAFDRVTNGGVIQIAAGVYPAPAQGWRSPSGRRFTVRATSPQVVLDGQGTRRLLHLRGAGVGAGRTIKFEGITFRGGFSNVPDHGGAVTIQSGEVVFDNCAFEANHHYGNNGGGAVRIAGRSDVRFIRSRFVDNESQRWGAAIFAQDSKVEVTSSELTGNRTNVAGHSANSAGGAIYLLDSQLTVSHSRFTANEAGWVGGAIYSIGNWDEAADDGVPASKVTITDSVFTHNAAAPDPCCYVPGQPGGGAIHAENETDVLIRGSRFDENVALWGGAIQSYRALIDIEGSFFRGNRGERTGTDVAAGGAINVNSSDFIHSSTGFGAFNRRPAELHVRDSLLLGRFGATTHAAEQGGCLFADGDRNRLNGVSVPQQGTAADNRARVKLDHVIFADCDIEAAPGVQALGGAILLLLADLEMTSSQVFDSDGAAAGGALLSLFDNRLIIRDSAFARNTALDSGAGVQVDTGHVEISDSLFVDNDVSPGVDEDELASQGSALVLARKSELGITGVVERSVFAGNSGIPIEDRDSSTGPSNKVTYVDNRIHSPAFGPKVYKNTPGSFSGRTVAELNSLVVHHSDGPFDKGTGNSYHPSPPTAGSLVAAPGAIARPTAARDPALANAFLGYVWSGTAAELAGDSLGARAGLLEVTENGTYELRIAGDVVASAGLGRCRDGQFCLNENRFLVEMDWRDHGGGSGSGKVVPFGSDDSGLFWFFNADNWEMLVKVLDGCALNNRYWVFAAATTNVEYTLRVTDVETGATVSYFNPLGKAAAAITDTEALATCDTEATASAAGRPPLPLPIASQRDAAAVVTPCIDGPSNLCLNQDRFELEIEWQTKGGSVGSGQVVPFGSDNSGLFWFFDADNWEMLVKVLNGCGLNNRYWVFAAATTDVGYTLRVTDTVTGEVKTYTNPVGRASPAITDTGAFATCP